MELSHTGYYRPKKKLTVSTFANKENVVNSPTTTSGLDLKPCLEEYTSPAKDDADMQMSGDVKVGRSPPGGSSCRDAEMAVDYECPDVRVSKRHKKKGKRDRFADSDDEDPISYSQYKEQRKADDVLMANLIPKNTNKHEYNAEDGGRRRRMKAQPRLDAMME